MKKLAALLFAVSILFLITVASGAQSTATTSVLPPNSGAVELPSTEVDRFQRRFARALARSLDDSRLRQVLHNGIDRRFDGDTNVLYREIANHPTGTGVSLRETLALHYPAAATKRAANSSRIEQLDAYATLLPRLQIAFPVGFDGWAESEEIPLVAWMPTAVDDTELHTIEAFGPTGEIVELDAQTPPERPVLVVSLNERTDENGYLRTGPTLDAVPVSTQKLQTVGEIDGGGGDGGLGGGGGGGGGTSSTCTSRTHSYGDKELFYQIYVRNDHEPWTKGSPEIYATYAFADNTGVKGKYHMTNVDDENRWYTLNGHLFYWQSYWGNTLIMSIWEEDVGSLGSFSYSHNGVSYTVGIQDDDDELGHNPISFNDPTCGLYSTGDADYKLRHTAP